MIIPGVGACLLLACGNRTQPPAYQEVQQEEKDNQVAGIATVAATVPCADAPPLELHLGDGTTSYNYYFIAEELKRRPGSETQTQETMRLEREAQQSSGMNILKGPSANVVESEFSHLLGAVMQSNGGVGAAVFDRHGLKIGAAGLQLQTILLPKPLLATIMQIGTDGASMTRRYTCEHLRELADDCENKESQEEISCLDLSRATKDCPGDIVGHYRPAFDANGQAIGVTMLVTQQMPCQNN